MKAINDGDFVKLEKMIQEPELFRSSGVLDDTFVKGVNLDGSFETYGDMMEFRISWIENTTNIKNFGMDSITSKFEKVAMADGKSEVRITFSHVENPHLRTSAEWAEKYGYQFKYIPSESSPGTVVWTKK